MAVDKNSKAYQSLQKSGYTDDQITQMHEQVAGWQNTKDVINSTPAANKNENQQSSVMMTDPIAYRPEYNNGKYDKYIEWRDPTKLNNADINLSQYWDDSSAKNYNKSELWWGENQKYTGENTLGSQIAYNPNATLEWLDPNYLYWQAAQMQNSKDANYIARRNDEIASALYNEWKVTVQDVADFLSQQNQWDYSNENERQNTIMSVWKRIGQIAEQNKKEEPANPEEPETNEPLENMESDLLRSTAWELYGKVTADQDTHITTLEDENSVYRAMNASRIQTFKNLQSMDSNSIASAIISGVMATDTQAMRDLMQYDPAKYQEVKQAEKQIRGQMNINAITSGEWDYNTVATNWQSGISNEITDFALSSSNWITSTADILKSVNSSLSSNQSAATASEQMATIENDMATLQNRMKNLKTEANKVFKWDVPQYIVNAYVANRTAEIQDQLSILENRYKAAQTRYQDERERTKWNAEFELKKEELQLKRESAVIDNWAAQQGVMQAWAKINWTVDWTTTTTQLTQQETQTIFQNFISSYKTWATWWQCGAFVKKYLSQLWISLPNISSIDAKKSLINPSITAPSDWDLVIMSSKNYPQNWHIAIVESVDDDWTMHILESNWWWDEKVHRRTVKPWDSSILGYYSPFASTVQQTEWDSGWKRNDGTSFNLSGSPVYNSLDEKSREAVKQLLNNNISKSSVSKRTWYEDAEWIFAAVSQINPLWSETDYNNRKTAENNWAKLEQWWATSRNATAVSTAKRIFDLVDWLSDKDLAKTEFKTINELINSAWENIWNTKVVELKTLLNWLQSEAAGALKWWNAAISDKDKQDMEAILNVALSKNQLKTAMEAMVKLLYDKNETEAKAIYNYWFYKKKPIWTNESVEWMNNDLWIDMSMYYDYKPSWTWKRFAWWYAPKFWEETYNVSSIWDLL